MSRSDIQGRVYNFFSIRTCSKLVTSYSFLIIHYLPLGPLPQLTEVVGNGQVSGRGPVLSKIAYSLEPTRYALWAPTNEHAIFWIVDPSQMTCRVLFSDTKTD